MKYCYALITFCLVAAAGCTSSAQNGARLADPAASDSALTMADEDIFDAFEDEFAEAETPVSDPIEPWNRAMFDVNDVFYFWVAKPVVQTYEAIMPRPARVGIGNFFANLTTPVRLVNCLIQGKGPEAGRELKRFGINTTAGVLGFGDPARDRCGLEPAEEDLGQSLAVHGLGDGFYLVWPLLGPSTLRDSVGRAGDAFLNPVRYVRPCELSLGISALDATNDGSFHIGEYESFKAASVDPYVAMREAYIQYRSKKIQE